MYVIQVTANRGATAGFLQGGFVSTYPLAGEANSTVSFNLPADRCTWETTTDADGNGYVISNVRFFDGITAAPLNPSEAYTGATTTTVFQLGYIGKSGRFVAITD